jgi:dipeptidyl aminopeptidase/acylaminoacyl peptidase
MNRQTHKPCPCRSARVVKYFPGSLANLKVKRVSASKVYVICSALATPEGHMYLPWSAPKSYSSAKIYSSLFVRHWDAWCTENHNSLWFGVLVKKDDEGRWQFENASLTNLLAGTRLSSPVAPFGGTGDFDVSSDGIVFVAKDPALNPARYTKTDLYYIPLKDDEVGNVPPQLVKTEGLRGYTMAPTFSGDGKKVAFLRMRSDQYESDRPRLMMIPDIRSLGNVEEFYKGRDEWEARPEWIIWGKGDSDLYVCAEKHGRAVLWAIPADSSTREAPRPLSGEGSVNDAKLLGDGERLLISSRSRVENSSYSILCPRDESLTEISSSSKHGRSLGLSKSQCSEIWYRGAAGYDNHALVMKPSHFDKTKKYPLAMLIHGGPQSAWTDDWSTRWNPAIFAEQGYVVVCPNPTGSTGYGQDHVDAITNNWGGMPYQDLVKCFEYLEKEVEYVDTDRAVALGASYGGYMISESVPLPRMPGHWMDADGTCRLDPGS